MQLVNKKNLSVTFAASKEESRYTMHAILVTEKETVATDGHIMARTSLPTITANHFPEIPGFNKNGFTRALLPVKTAQEIEKAIPRKQTMPILENAVISMDDNNVQVAVTDLDTPKVFTIRPVEGQFPKWEAVWDHKDKDGKDLPPSTDITFDATILKRLMDAAVKFSDHSGPKSIRMRFYGENSSGRFDLVNTDGQEMNVVVMPIRPDLKPKPQFKPE